MSACSEFAEHVWKPGSCKNCFHPRSAHAKGRKSLCRDEQEDEGASASTYIKPTIAVKPTMINLDTTEKTAEFTMSTQQAHKSSIELKNILELSSLYIDSNGCSKTLKDVILQNGISTKLDYSSRTPVSPKAPPTTGCVFIMQEDCRSPVELKENFSPQVAKTQTCTYITSCDSHLHHHKQEVQVITNTATGNINGAVNGAAAEMHSVLSSPVATPGSLNNASMSDFSHCSSSDSLTGLATIQSEPIYAESSKRKCRPRQNADLITEVSDDGEVQRATITVMAAHTGETNRTFYLSSPDSAVSTQWLRFSPTTPDDPSSPVFSWPSSPVIMGTTPVSADLSTQTETKASPPIPPKRNSRSPKLGTSSLSPLPEFNFHMSPPLKLSQGEAHSSCPVLSSLWSSEPRAKEEEKKETEREWKDKCESTPGTNERNNSPSEKQVEMKSDSSCSSEPRPPLPPPKKHHRSFIKLSVSSMELDQRGSVESLPHSVKEMNATSSDSLPALTDSVVQESTQHSCPSLFPNSSLCPPPLPEKKLLSRTTSSDIETKFKSHAVTSCSSPQLTNSSSVSLQTLLSSGASRECVYARLGGLYSECVRRLTMKCEERYTHPQKHTHRFFNEHEWSLFKLSCSRAVCVTRDAAYYPASCSSDIHTPYAVKICKGHTQEVRRSHLFGLSVQQSIPHHFNLQQDCGHFIACVPLSMLPGQEETLAPPSSPSTTPLDQQERVVVITRDVPSESLADFVSEYQSFHRSHPEVYERRVCFLLLQLCNALEHLKAHGVTHRDLCLENMLLVPQRQLVTSSPTHQEPLPRLLISNFSKAKRRCETDEKQRAELTRMAPEIVSASQYRKVDEFQTGILIYEMLHLPNPFEAVPSLQNRHYRIEELPSIPSVSIYSSGLERLARLLLRPDPDERIHIAEAKRGLQSLLWGPRRELLDRVTADNRKDKDQDTLLNWLDVKRALLMMKFAERSLEPEKTPELEDWLCCQYFSNTHPPSLMLTAQMMHLIKPSH